MNDTPTPRTDEATNDSALENKNHPHTDWVPAHFARTLERELAQANRQIATMCAVLTRILTDCTVMYKYSADIDRVTTEQIVEALASQPVEGAKE